MEGRLEKGAAFVLTGVPIFVSQRAICCDWTAKGSPSNAHSHRLWPVLLQRLCVWWRVARTQGKMLNDGWLFPGMNPSESLSTRLLEAKVGIQVLLGHRKLKTTTLYTLVVTNLLGEVIRPQEATRASLASDDGAALEITDIFRPHGPPWLQSQQSPLSLGQLNGMSAIEQCRSAALGGTCCAERPVRITTPTSR
jgi:hypothetical protein